MTEGSTTTVGTGNYTFSLPFATAGTPGEQVLPCELFDGANHYGATSLAGANSTTLSLFSLKGGSSGTMVAMAGGSAFAANVGAIMVVQGVYQIA